jgi:hypothetical protein
MGFFARGLFGFLFTTYSSAECRRWHGRCNGLVILVTTLWCYGRCCTADGSLRWLRTASAPDRILCCTVPRRRPWPPMPYNSCCSEARPAQPRLGGLTTEVEPSLPCRAAAATTGCVLRPDRARGGDRARGLRARGFDCGRLRGHVDGTEKGAHSVHCFTSPRARGVKTGRPARWWRSCRQGRRGARRCRFAEAEHCRRDLAGVPGRNERRDGHACSRRPCTRVLLAAPRALSVLFPRT